MYLFRNTSFEVNYYNVSCFIKLSEGPIFSSGLESANEMKIIVNINLPSYSDNLKTVEISSIESNICKILKSNIFLENHKKSMIKVKYDILEFTCDFTHYCLLTGSFGFMNLGIEQKGILTCANIIVLQNGNILVDPDLEEEKRAISKVQIASLVDTEEVISYIQKGPIDENQSNKEEKDKKFDEIVSVSLGVCKAYKNLILKLI